MVQYISIIPDIKQVKLKDHPIGDSFLLDGNIYIKTDSEEEQGDYHTYYACMCISGIDAGKLRNIMEDMSIIPINIQISIESPKVYYSNFNFGESTMSND